jgi:hypothetical protein
MGLFQSVTISAAPLSSGVLPLAASPLLSVLLTSVLSIAGIGLWYARPRRRHAPRVSPLAHSTAA